MQVFHPGGAKRDPRIARPFGPRAAESGRSISVPPPYVKVIKIRIQAVRSNSGPVRLPPSPAETGIYMTE
ncbi:hypothetical protein SAMN05428954_3806 [Streptomyces sp. 2112.3]|nr:hypothetical protein SAMN05428954_3806 [Streptomyces sp. 2112.3]